MSTPLPIIQGSTFDYVVRWETTPIVYKAITGITAAAPAVITCPGHSVPDGWRVAVVSVRGMTEINAVNEPPKTKDLEVATVLTSSTIELNDVNAAGYSTYTGGGYVRYHTPMSLTDYTARMTIKDRIGGTELLSLTTENDRIVIDTAAYTIQLLLSATDTAAITTWTKGVYDLELVSGTGVVTKILSGTVAIIKEATT